MSAFSKVRVVSVSKDDTKKLEEEARRMEAKLELLRRTMDSTEPAKRNTGAESGRWRNGTANKPLTKGFAKTVLEAKPPAKIRSTSQQRACDSTMRDVSASRSMVGSEEKAHALAAAVATCSPSSQAAANLQAHMAKQSQEGLEVEAFLASLNLDRYVSLFMEQGFDCMEVVQEMQEIHMKDLGMAPGHILKLRKKLAELAPPPAAPVPPPAAPRVPRQGATERQVSFGGTEEAPLKVESSTRDAGGKLSQGAFNEEESAASFQEALRAWREGPTTTAANGNDNGRASSLKASPGSFWSNLGDCEMDLTSVSTPNRASTEPLLAETEAQHGPDPGEEKLCCYQCFKQFYAKYAVLRESLLADTGGPKVKRLCSEACAEKWTAAMKSKAEAVRQRQEKFDKMQEMQRALELEKRTAVESALQAKVPVEATHMETGRLSLGIAEAALTQVAA